MKKTLSLVAVLAAGMLPLSAQTGVDPAGTLAYALPSTVITLEVEAVQEHFYAGPYAKFAQKYLGTAAREADASSCEVVSVKLTPCTEADQSKRYTITPGKGVSDFLSLTSQGLVSTGGAASSTTLWRFPSSAEADFATKGVSSAIDNQSAVLYRKSASSEGIVSVQQNMSVAKPLETRAKEAADKIFDIRNKKYDIITGNTDATFSGEALGAAIAELDRLEKEYLTLFLGYSDKTVQVMNYDVLPTADNAKQIYIAFRVSDSEGLVPADNMSGKPYIIQLAPQEVSAPVATAKPAASGLVAHYRIPAVCSVKLTDGVNVLLQTRIPVYQLGVESTFPIVITK